jgi:folylpolyglutamate synthase/dihydropteroate synthase
VPRGRIVFGGAREAAGAFAGHPLDASVEVILPGRLEQRPAEIRDGAHNADGIAWLAGKLDRADYTICASILGDKDVRAMLRRLSALGDRLVATTSSNARALTAEALAELARPFFATVEAVDDPAEAVRRAHALGDPVLVTGSLYLLADLEAAEA